MRENGKLRPGSLALQFVLELFFGIVLPRKMLTNRNILDYHARHIWATMDDLVRDGYVGYVRFVNKRYCYLTRKGFQLLERTDPRFGVNSANYRRHQFYEREIREQARDGEVYLAMERCGFHASPHLRIAFEDLLNQRLPEKSRIRQRYEAWNWTKDGKAKAYAYEDLFEEGVFFTSKEVRYAARQLNFMDLFVRSRFSGILIYRSRLFICYNTMERMLKWSAACEDSARKGLHELLYRFDTDAGRGSVRANEQEMEGIVFGHSIARNLKRLAWGNTKEAPDDKSQDKIAYLSRKLLYSGNIKGFPHMYFVSMENGRMAADMRRLFYACFHIDQIREREKQIFNSMPDAARWVWLNEWTSEYERPGYYWGRDGKRYDVYRLPVIELKMLHFLMSRDRDYILFAFPEDAGYLEEVLGPHLFKIYGYCDEEMGSVEEVPHMSRL